MDIKEIEISKNRGWRGLAEVKCVDDKRKEVIKMIFSFSPLVWKDMLHGIMVVQDDDNYIVLKFDNTEKLPKPTQQRSVTITRFTAHVTATWTYPKTTWISSSGLDGNWSYIQNFITNRNNHTTSDWNCVGIRVVPII